MVVVQGLEQAYLMRSVTKTSRLRPAGRGGKFGHPIDLGSNEYLRAVLGSEVLPHLAGFEVTVTDLLLEPQRRTDALIFFGGDDHNWVRMVVRPSGTEPKVKSYIEVRCAAIGDLEATRAKASAVQDELAGIAQRF